ncbi:hypothetical protein C5167_032099 [Papaver somniferum]|uniref:Beta-fructofuranosidase n=1 Tax=Papaver somniferum TaxID=3469 RepID=A0A4Y7K9A4_PAPSO|nr:hypothetical protein C5167_032099 [Papaver somniferum]
MDYLNIFRKFKNLGEETYSSSYSYNSLPADNDQTKSNETTIVPGNLSRPRNKGLIVILSAVMSVALFVVVLLGKSRTTTSSSPLVVEETLVSRGVTEGVSEKAFLQFYGDVNIPYHFQPEKNWMNGPLFYKGWYHLFYQYNPYGAIWGNIVWGHTISRDLIHWLYLPEAMVPDHWYDSNGVWTGSATLLPDGSIVMIYTGSTNESVQVQNVAFPANLSDPLLIKWVKYSGNPILYPPPGIGLKDFRDPTTAWYTPENKWRITVGSKLCTTGTSLVYETVDFLNYTLLDKVLHEVPDTGMWECVDFYPVSMTGDNGLDTSVNGPGVKHVWKASLDDIKKDYYALGSYDVVSDVWTPDDLELDVGIGLRYDYGKFYASKTLYDQKKREEYYGAGLVRPTVNIRILRRTIPRTVLFDGRTTTNLLQWPVEEVESLRLNCSEFNNIDIQTGSVVPLDVGIATQLDVAVEFEITEKSLDGMTEEADVGYNCTTSGGAAGRGRLGPFGLLVLADKTQSEQTAVYFYVAKGIDGDLTTFFCTDESRSSEANDVGKQVYGNIVPVLDGHKLTMRILVDHSIVESFAQGGRTCITARVYPTKAIYAAAQLFLFNNATKANIKATSIKIWQMNSAFIRPY